MKGRVALELSEEHKEMKRRGQVLLRKAGLDCPILFRKGPFTARHVTLVGGGCAILINPEVKIWCPEHLILHEGAHHGQPKHEAAHGPKWARRLIELYAITDTPLPHSTKHEWFRRLAGLRARTGNF